LEFDPGKEPENPGILGLLESNSDGKYLAFSVLNYDATYKFRTPPNRGWIEDAEFRITANANTQEWIAVEYWINTNDETTGVYIWTQDGQTYTIEDVQAPAGVLQTGFYMTYFNGYGNADSGNYYLIDNMEVSTEYIGPPAGFLGGTQTYECNDGVDNDGDGATDHGQDGGCVSDSDNDESDCGDGVCEGGETSGSCVIDCDEPICGEGVCITGVDNNEIIEGQSLTINGVGFGSGPTVLLFDDFEGGINGNPLSTDLAPLGSWDSVQTPGHTSYSDLNTVSGNFAARFDSYDYPPNQHPVIYARAPTSFDSFYVSWWGLIPSGDRFPGCDGYGGCNWKTVWVLDDSNNVHDADVCIAANGHDPWLVFGNDYPYEYSPYLNFESYAGVWHRFQYK